MVPQQSQDGNAATSELDAKDENDLMPVEYQDTMTVFGSQQVKETSNTPYTDATQVSATLQFIPILLFQYFKFRAKKTPSSHLHLAIQVINLCTNQTLGLIFCGGERGQISMEFLN